ncbi:MAG: hypothetical protein GY805_33475 [Chloroflexi bacterium]|nr:hypothetical protein [Chloroflexota bacterium]
MKNFRQTTDLIWNIADLLRGDYKPREYVDIILPLTVFYRLDLAMASSLNSSAYVRFIIDIILVSSVIKVYLNLFIFHVHFSGGTSNQIDVRSYQNKA